MHEYPGNYLFMPFKMHVWVYNLYPLNRTTLFLSPSLSLSLSIEVSANASHSPISQLTCLIAILVLRKL